MTKKKITHKAFVKLLSLVLFISLATPIKIKPIPHLKGLFTILKTDDIGLGQALLYSNFIKNVYLYAPDNDSLKTLIKKFWHILGGIPTENLLPTKQGPFAVIPLPVFSRLMSYVYKKNI